MKHQVLSHWKFRKLHRALGCESIAHTAGYLELLWLHCQQSENGPVMRKDEVEAVCDWTGEPCKLVNSLLMFTWLDGVNGGELVEVHDWADHAPGYVKRRDYMADYMRKYRKDKKEQSKEIEPALTIVNTRKTPLNHVNDPTKPNLTKPNHNSLSNDSKSDLSIKAHTKPQAVHSRPSGAGADGDSPSFIKFWEAYPRKVGKGEARKAWKKHGCDKLNGEILAAVEKQKHSAQWKKDHGQYIPNPATWLNQQRWEDELPEHKNAYGEVLAEEDDDLGFQTQEEIDHESN